MLGVGSWRARISSPSTFRHNLSPSRAEADARCQRGDSALVHLPGAQAEAQAGARDVSVLLRRTRLVQQAAAGNVSACACPSCAARSGTPLTPGPAARGGAATRGPRHPSGSDTLTRSHLSSPAPPHLRSVLGNDRLEVRPPEDPKGADRNAPLLFQLQRLAGALPGVIVQARLLEGAGLAGRQTTRGQRGAEAAIPAAARCRSSPRPGLCGPAQSV